MSVVEGANADAAHGRARRRQRRGRPRSVRTGSGFQSRARKPMRRERQMDQAKLLPAGWGRLARLVRWTREITQAGARFSDVQSVRCLRRCRPDLHERLRMVRTAGNNAYSGHTN